MKRLLSVVLLALSSSALAQTSATTVTEAHGVNRTVEALSLDTVSVKDYGAIGDGASHPACTALGLSTLAALQAYKGGIYSFATACTNQLDWLATQYSVNFVSPGGGTVTFPDGNYTFDQPLILPLSLDQTAKAPGVYLVGAGEGSTFLQPNVGDFGAGSALVSCGSVTASYSDNSNAGSGRYSNNGCFGGVSDLTLENPYQTTSGNVTSASYAQGVTNVPAPATSAAIIQMDGLKLGARMSLHRIAVWEFRMGMNVVGDHMSWDQLTFNHNFCGIYFAPSSIYLYGDITMMGNNPSTANYLAGMCVDKDSGIADFFKLASCTSATNPMASSSLLAFQTTTGSRAVAVGRPPFRTCIWIS